jgi:hypothetical protein
VMDRRAAKELFHDAEMLIDYESGNDGGLR